MLAIQPLYVGLLHLLIPTELLLRSVLYIFKMFVVLPHSCADSFYLCVLDNELCFVETFPTSLFGESAKNSKMEKPHTLQDKIPGYSPAVKPVRPVRR